MSYARSPRPLCSITIGIRPRPWGSSMRLLSSMNETAGKRRWPRTKKMGPRHPCVKRRPATGLCGPARSHYLLERHRPIGDLRARHDPVDDVLLEHHRLEVTKPLGLLVMPAHHRLRLLVSLRGFGHDRPHLVRLRVQVLPANELADDQAQGYTLLGLRSKEIDRYVEVFGFDVLPLAPVRNCLRPKRLRVAFYERLRHLEACEPAQAA